MTAAATAERPVRPGSPQPAGTGVPVLALDRVTKSFCTPGGRTWVAREISLAFPPGRAIALLGRNGAGKSTLLAMLAGTLRPDAGRVIANGTVSWPVGFLGSFHRDLTGAQNTRFVARVYGVDCDRLCGFVASFSELGEQFRMPLAGYSAGMRARLAFALSMGIRFDVYLVDEVTAVGDAAFREKSRAVFAERMKGAGAVLVSHEMPQVRRFCEAACVLENGHLTWYDDLDEAIAVHRAMMG